jgi:beta-lactamase class A
MLPSPSGRRAGDEGEMCSLALKNWYNVNYRDRSLLLSCLILGLMLILPMPIVAATPLPRPTMTTKTSSPVTVLERFFKTDTMSADWFTAEFLAALPIGQIQAIITQLKQELGAFKSVTPDGEGFVLQFSQGSISAQISLTAEGKVAGLFFGGPQRNFASLADAIGQFKALPGTVSLLVMEGKTIRASLNPTTALGVGSAFKLAVLDVLQSQIAAKKLTWETIVPLQSKFKSLPSGRLQTWPDGSVLTVQSLAAMMIAESDNTATDHLIQLVGRETIEAIAPRNKPFLMTREMFQLKAKGNQALLARYRAGTLVEKRSMLQSLAQQPLPGVAEFEGAQPNALDVEWLFEPGELCGLIDRVKELPLMSINPGIARAKDWRRVVFKGGSEPGVLNLTTGVEGTDGKWYCVAATWNADRVLDEGMFLGLYGGLIEVLRRNGK